MSDPQRVGFLLRCRACAGLPLAFFASLGLANASGAGADVWLDVSSPPSGAISTSHVPLVEVRGRAGATPGGRHDLVLVLDLSRSTLVASGVDVDGDGKLGKTSDRVMRMVRGRSLWPFPRRPDQFSSDLGDSVRAAEVAAGLALLARLDPEHTRVGLVTFHDEATLEAPVASPHGPVSAALARIADEEEQKREPGGATDFAAALDAALAALAVAGPENGGEEPRASVTRSVVFLSDGQPTSPPGPEASELSRAAATRVAEAGVRLHTFAIGPEAAEHFGIYREIAERTRGSSRSVAVPADIVAELSLLDLANVAAIEIDNLTSGNSARALRTFPDGSFDAVATLVPGTNELRVTARDGRGRATQTDRLVHFDSDSADPDELARMRRQLEARTAETELLRGMRRARDERIRSLEIREDGAVD